MNTANWGPLQAALICETSEACTYASIVAAAQSIEHVSLEASQFAGGVALRCPHERATTLLNRVIGLGLHEEITGQIIGDLATHYAAAGAPWGIELTPAATSPEVLAMLKGVRLRRSLPTAVLAIGCDRHASLPPPVRIERVGAEWGEEAANIEAGVFGVSTTFRSLLAALAKVSSFRQWLAFEGETPVAACLTHVAGEVAWFGWCATLPEFRGRGIQSALLSSCIADAGQLGCRWMTAETAVGTADLPDRSFRNMLRFGFAEVYRRHTYIHIPRGMSSSTADKPA
jgi:GNAT superfamily N-acetyltransferase